MLFESCLLITVQVGLSQLSSHLRAFVVGHNLVIRFGLCPFVYHISLFVSTLRSIDLFLFFAACPNTGGPGGACFGNGVCSDGMTGNGQCACHPGVFVCLLVCLFVDFVVVVVRARVFGCNSHRFRCVCVCRLRWACLSG